MYITENDNPRIEFLRDKTHRLTESPGCYIMKNKTHEIIYIGKAKNLKNRVSSYFRAGQDHLPKVWKMVQNVYDYEFIVTDSEFEALVLECSLIKQYKPKYNILLKDDKGYSYIKVTNEEYPRLQAALQKEDDGARYIGPYTSSFAVRQAVTEANKVFMLPTCSRVFPRDIKKQRPCLNLHIKLCMGVCTGRISKKEYTDIVDQAVDFITSGSQDSVKRLTEEMNEAAENLEFERAAKLRDRINAINKAAESQKIIDEKIKDMDIVAVAQNAQMACASVIMYRGGRLFDKSDHFLGEKMESSQMLEQFLMQYYSSKDKIVKEILIGENFENREIVQQYLQQKAGHSVRLFVPQRGSLVGLTQLAKSNAAEYISNKTGRTKREVTALEELSKALGLEKPPRFIECYDISNLASTNMVAGMVVFENGRPCKKYYKRFSIKTVEEQNDYECMREVLHRRFENYFEKTDEGFSIMPDLILLDGGKGHVNAVEPMLRKMGVNCPLFGLVKDSRHRTRAVATGEGEIALSKNRSAFNLATAIQDEVHRFAITYQAKKHRKNAYQLELTKVKGVGDKKAAKLITTFKTKEAMKGASVEQIAQTAGVNAETAAQLKAIIDEM